MTMQKTLPPDDIFDIYFDVYETLFERIRELMNRQTDISTLKTMRDHVVQAVAAIASIEPESIYRELEGVRRIGAGSETQ